MSWRCTKCAWVGPTPVIIRVGLRPSCPICLAPAVEKEIEGEANETGGDTKVD